MRLAAFEQRGRIAEKAREAIKRAEGSKPLLQRFPPPVVSTGWPELDRLIGCRWEPAGPPEAVGSNGPWEVTRTPLQETGEPLGFPRARISVVEGPEVPGPEVWAEKLGGVVWSNPDWRALLKWVRDERPPAVVIAVPPTAGFRFDVLATYAQLSETTPVWVLPAGVQIRALKFYAHIRLLFAEGRVKILKTAISAQQGHYMPWPIPAGWVPGPEQWIPDHSDFEDDFADLE